MLNSSGGDSAKCADTKTVDVSVAPELYGVVFNTAQKVAGQGYVCATYHVTSADGSDVADGIKSGANVPDVWIPDSSVWVDEVSDKLGGGWVNVSGILATSPIGIAFPKSIAADRSQVGDTWASAYTDVKRLTLEAPTDSASPYVTFAVATVADLPHDARTNLLRAVIGLTRSTMGGDTLATKATLNQQQARAYPLSEQQMIAFNKAHASTPLTAVVPKQGAPQLDYPFVTPVRASGSANSAAVSALYAALSNASGQSALSAAGFRTSGDSTPTGTPFPAGVTVLNTPDQSAATEAVKAWAELGKDARMLVLIDGSGSMTTEMAPGLSRIQLLSQTAIAALHGLPQTTEIGAWVFTTNADGKGGNYLPLSEGIQQIGHTPQGDKYRAQLEQQAKTIPEQLVAKNGDTPLYLSILAAFKKVNETYDPKYVNSVVVLTDGKDDVPHGKTIALQALLSQLKSLYNPDKPVKIVTIGIGPDTDQSALKAIATATNGLAYQTSKPEDIANVFVDAFLHRG